MIYYKKHSHIKKQVIAEKCKQLLRTNKYVLFFHYNGGGSGKKGCNWQHVKEKLGVSYKSLLVPSKISGSYCKQKNQEQESNPEVPGSLMQKRGCKEKKPTAHYLGKDISAFSPLFQGGALLVGCSSPGQMAAVLEKCTSPTFLCIGGAFDMHPMSHLDVKRWVLLKNTRKDTYAALVTQLLHRQNTFISLSTSLLNLPLLSTGVVMKKFITLLHLLKKKKSLQQVPLSCEDRG